MKLKSPDKNVSTTLDVSQPAMLPLEAQKKVQGWIRSRHLICSGSFFIFETVDYGMIERFSDCVSTLGGTVISVEPVDKIWMGSHRQVMLYRVKVSLLTPGHNLKQYWIKYGSFRTRFDCNP
ncbi:MAG: CpeR family transcriptional regulator [Cyanobacteria bacterium P01_H01_bin.15]